MTPCVITDWTSLTFENMRSSSHYICFGGFIITVSV